ncbi:amidase [Komagataeibacter medellinensis]|uniref:Amidase n=2 Tax=Komagataeibacter medellinensis TaxID=1177712 RepID=A0ABQ6VSF9_9PROT|nr:amidase [Komagataeibacter medellinensis]
MTSLCDVSAIGLCQMMRAGDVSAREVLDSCLERIEEINPAINAIVAMDVQAARTQADRADKTLRAGEEVGPLCGLPVGIKDTHVTAHLRTTFGSPIYASYVPEHDQGIVHRLRAAGAVIVGKTNTPEWAAGANSRNPVYGATGNPFNPLLSAAGSSGGSGAALACGMLPLCTGSDTGGSLRNPAAFNGIVGMRPSPGLVANERRPQGWFPLSVDGPMARNVADTALMLSVITSDSCEDPLAYTLPTGAVRAVPQYYTPTEPAITGRLRLAVTEDFGFAPTENLVRRAFRARLPAIGTLFGSMTQAHPDCTQADEAFSIQRASMFLSAHHERYVSHFDQIGPNIRANIEEGLKYTLHDQARAAVQQTRIYRSYQAFFQDHDILISPAITLSPRPWTELYPAEIDGKKTRSYYHWLALAYAVTLAGHPAISIPVGLDEAGMPFGLQIVGPRGGDVLLLQVALAVEQALASDPVLCRPLPDLDALRRAPPIAQYPGFFG